MALEDISTINLASHYSALPNKRTGPIKSTGALISKFFFYL